MKLIIFGGTGESMKLAKFLQNNGVNFQVSVVSQEAADSYSRLGIPVRHGALDADELRKYLAGTEVVVDCAHPFADDLHANLKKLSEKTGFRYIRYIRGPGLSQDEFPGIVVVKSFSEAAEVAKGIPGKIFLSSGIKSISAFTGKITPDRLVVRILPRQESIKSVKMHGIPEENIIALRSPFTAGFNISLFRQYGIRTLVTKESGSEAGVQEKLSAARAMGINIVVIGRPESDTSEQYRSLDSLAREILKIHGVENPVTDVNAVLDPAGIEDRSLSVVGQVLSGMSIEAMEKIVLSRIIYATADFDYKDTTIFTENAVESAVEAIRDSVPIVVDVNMVSEGINRKLTSNFKNDIFVFRDASENRYAADEKMTRAASGLRVAMDRYGERAIYVIGNAPTALLELLSISAGKHLKPRLIIAFPVGFTNASESKRKLAAMNDLQYITSIGPKGGSPAAAACMNALLKIAGEKPAEA
ncbi:MAG: precorrin-6A reductase [Candidatus Thermoplasmatota archaeon]|nr:precorrin-6A reductase [Candidatus Thermoplasmatota archaeon]